MARERRVVPVMVRIEPSLYDLLTGVLAKDAVSGSEFMRTLLVTELKRRGLLNTATVDQLVGTR